MPSFIDDLTEWSKHWRPSGWIEKEIGRIGKSTIGYASSESSAKVQLFRAGNREGPLGIRLVFAGKQTLILSTENAFQLADYLIQAADEIENA